jgi:hypothetical protein
MCRGDAFSGFDLFEDKVPEHPWKSLNPIIWIITFPINMALWWYTTCAHPSIIKLMIHPMLSPLWLVGIVMKIFLVSKSPVRGLSHLYHLYHVYIFIHGLKGITPLIAEYDHSNKKHITKQRDLHGRPVSLPPEPWHMFTTTQQREIRNALADQHGHPISQNWTKILV